MRVGFADGGEAAANQLMRRRDDLESIFFSGRDPEDTTFGGRGIAVPRGGTVSNESSMRYTIDAEDKICFVDEAWCQFAEANDGAVLTRLAVLGHSLWDYITDETTCKLYQQIVSRVRQGKLARFTLRCDSPACRRFLEMAISAALDGSVEFETHTMRVEDREPVELLSRNMKRSTQLLRACAWCNRIDVGYGSNDWVEVEDATERLRLIELGQMPQLTHGICAAFVTSMMGTLANMDANA